MLLRLSNTEIEKRVATLPYPAQVFGRRSTGAVGVLLSSAAALAIPPLAGILATNLGAVSEGQTLRHVAQELRGVTARGAFCGDQILSATARRLKPRHDGLSVTFNKDVGPWPAGAYRALDREVALATNYCLVIPPLLVHEFFYDTHAERREDYRTFINAHLEAFWCDLLDCWQDTDHHIHRFLTMLEEKTYVLPTAKQALKEQVIGQLQQGDDLGLIPPWMTFNDILAIAVRFATPPMLGGFDLEYDYRACMDARVRILDAEQDQPPAERYTLQLLRHIGAIE